MKIALLTDNLNSGGAQRQLVTLAIGLKKRGLDVVFIVYNPGHHYEPALKNSGIPLFKFFKSSKYDIIPLFRIQNFLTKHRIDCLVAFLFAPTIIAALAKLLTKRKIKLIVSERSYSNYRKESLTTKLARWMYRFADRITVNSMSQYNFLLTHCVANKDKLIFIPNGLDLTTFAPSLTRLNNETVELLSVGHVNSVKNTKLIIEALHKLKEHSVANFRLTWMGRTFDITGIRNLYFDDCKSLIVEYGLADHWRWISETENLVPYYHNADLLIHASIGEGFSNVVMEALSCGVPVVASDVNDNATIIRHEKNGFLFPSGDATSLAQIILEYLNTSEQTRQELKAAARSTAVASFSEDRMIESYHKLFDEIRLPDET